MSVSADMFSLVLIAPTEHSRLHTCKILMLAAGSAGSMALDQSCGSVRAVTAALSLHLTSPVSVFDPWHFGRMQIECIDLCTYI